MLAIEIEPIQQCRTCGETKSLREFDFRNDRSKPRTQCRPCRRAYQRGRWVRSVRPPRIFDLDATYTCTRCRGLKSASEFPPRRTGSRLLQSWCRACFREFNALNYANNRERERARIRRNRHSMRAENRARLDEHLRTHPCVDCGERDIRVLDFDHLRDKRRNVTDMLHLSWTTIEAEIAKCEVRCANDHRRATYERRKEEERRKALKGSDPGGN